VTKVYNKTSQKQMRQRLRRNMPKAEALLWARLRRRQVLGYKFRRQFSVGPYSIDFYCPALKLAVEIDGDSHFSEAAIAYDRERQYYIETFGIHFLRFTNNQVYKSQDDVVESIAQTILQLKQKDLTLPSLDDGDS
jgi:very-short-patch-repair endonuclease